jgi:GTPase SAR1 family protein
MSRVDLKVVLLGSEYVGKTSLLERYVYDRFRGNLPYQNVSNLTLKNFVCFYVFYFTEMCW